MTNPRFQRLTTPLVAACQALKAGDTLSAARAFVQRFPERSFQELKADFAILAGACGIDASLVEATVARAGELQKIRAAWALQQTRDPWDAVALLQPMLDQHSPAELGHGLALAGVSFGLSEKLVSSVVDCLEQVACHQADLVMAANKPLRHQLA